MIKHRKHSFLFFTVFLLLCFDQTFAKPYSPGRPYRYEPSSGQGTTPPKSPGEYRIFKPDQKSPVYIGETNNLDRRLKEHRRTGKITEGDNVDFMIADPDSTSNTRREHEQKSIAKHNPSLNKSKGGEGRPAKNDAQPQGVQTPEKSDGSLIDAILDLFTRD